MKKFLVFVFCVLLLTACSTSRETSQDRSASTQASIVAAWDTARTGNFTSLWEPMPMDWTVTWLQNHTMGDMYKGSDFSADIDAWMSAWGDEIPDAAWIPDPDEEYELDDIMLPSAWGIL